MIFTEKIKQDMLGTIVLELGVMAVIVFFLLEAPLDPEIYRVLLVTLVFLITLAAFEGFVILIHYKTEPSKQEFNPPV